jgi:sugar O-acyltransferase (sialic acid O-acetyltransferase NeuD family)
MPSIAVVGAGGMGREVGEMVLASSDAGELLGFLDDAPELQGTSVMGYPVLGPTEWIADHPDVQLVMGMGHPRIRRRVADRLTALGAKWLTLLHPSVIVSPSATIGTGAVVFAGCILSANSRLGDFTYLNYNTVISHDAQVGDHACIMAQVALSGNVRVGEGSFIGVGVSTRQGVSVGEWTIVGAGASIVRDIPALCVAAGVPARPQRSYASPEEMPPF